MIRGTLMNGSDQVWALGVLKFEAEVALLIGLSASGFFHASTEREEYDFVAGGRFAGVTFFTVPVSVCAETTAESRSIAKKTSNFGLSSSKGRTPESNFINLESGR